jgi:preprotein translocase subunit SecA
MEGLHEDLTRITGLKIPVADWAKEEGVDDAVIIERLEKTLDEHMDGKVEKYGKDFWGHVEKSLLLQVVDQEWKDHLANLDHLRQGVGLRAYGQRDPLNEYKTEAFSLFENMLYHTRESVTQLLSNAQLAPQVSPEQLMPESPSIFEEQHLDPITGENEMTGGINPNDPSTWGDVPRNAPCPCGSGKKFKHCHGDMASSQAPSLQRAASGNKPVQNPFSTTGRNDPCPCGSGKKYKHCCGAL